MAESGANADFKVKVEVCDLKHEGVGREIARIDAQREEDKSEFKDTVRRIESKINWIIVSIFTSAVGLLSTIGVELAKRVLEK